MKSLIAFLRRPLNLFYLVSITGIVGFFVCACLVKRGTLFNWLIMEHNSNFVLTDFSRHIGFAADLKSVYYINSDACFPPLAYLLFHFFYMINPIAARLDLWYQGVRIQDEPIIYILWTLLQALTLAYFIKKTTKFSLGETILFSLALFFSLPFFGGALERGNTVFLTVLLLCAALYLRNQEERWKQELALILIAYAAGLKITPCVVGFLYLKERRWGESLYLMLYGALFFFLPFALTGGLDGMRQFFRIIAEEAGIQTDWWTSFPGFVRYWMLNLFGREIPGVDSAARILFLGTMVAFTFLTRKNWKTVLYLSMIMAYAHAKTYRYYTIYLILPLICMIAETRDEPRRLETCLYYLLFGAVFTIPIWGINGDPERWMCGAAYLLCLCSLLTDARELFSGRGRRLAAATGGQDR